MRHRIILILAVLVGTPFVRAQEHLSKTIEQQLADVTAQLAAEREAHRRDVLIVQVQLDQCRLSTTYTELQRYGCAFNPQTNQIDCKAGK